MRKSKTMNKINEWNGMEWNKWIDGWMDGPSRT
jgi:hypothetical protein